MRLSSYVDEDGVTVRATENEEEVFADNPLVLRLSSLCASCIPPHSRRTARRCNVHFYGRSQSGRHAGYALSAYRVAFYAILSRFFRLLFSRILPFFLSLVLSRHPHPPSALLVLPFCALTDIPRYTGAGR